MDILYPVRKGDWNDELRYSLRSLANLPHDAVRIVGYRPSWVTGVQSFFREQAADKYGTANGHLQWAIDRAALSERFYLFNDDFYVMRPMDRVPVLHMGPLGEMIDRYRARHHTGAYFRNMVATFQLLRDNGFSRPLSYELHIPMAMDKGTLREAFNMGGHIPGVHIRTVYGNLAGVGGELSEDMKVYSTTEDYEEWPFLSSNDNLYQGLGVYLQKRFPYASPYESDRPGPESMDPGIPSSKGKGPLAMSAKGQP